MINAQDEKGNIESFSPEDEPLITHFANNAAIAIERAQMTRAIILRMVNMAELRDPKETGAHVNRVAGYAIEIYENWAVRKGYSKESIDKVRDVLRMAAMLHDVGKVAISDVILKKPGRLTEEEFEIMKQHTFLGARLFGNAKSDFDEAAQDVALNHHEKWNGKGYPGFIDLARKGNRLFRNLRHGSYLVMVVKGAIGSTELRRQQQLSLDLCEQPAGFGKNIKLRWVFDRGRGSEIASGRILDPPIALAHSCPSQVFDLAVQHECGAG